MILRPGSPASVDMRPERIDLARRRCAEWVKSGHTPTLGVSVARRGRVVLEEYLGVQGPEAGDPPLSERSIFPVASVTKSITAVLVLQLVEDGRLGLNRPAIDYLPEIEGPHRDEILVHHLLTHTTGIPWHTDPPVLRHARRKLDAGFEPRPCPENQHPGIHHNLELLWDVPREEPPGRLMRYSNHNYVLLGEILRRLTGRAIEDLARERVFDPLGMDDSYYVVPESEAPRVVQRPPGIPFADTNWLFPGLGSHSIQCLPDAGMGLFSTPRDLVRFGQMILDGGRLGDARVLSPAAVAAATRDQVPGLEATIGAVRMPNASWGYGFAIESPTKWRYFHGSLVDLGTLTHPGAGGAMYWIDRRNEIVGAYFEVCTRVTEDWEFLWNYDLFENLITSAVDA